MDIEDVKPGMIYAFDPYETYGFLSLRIVLSAKKRRNNEFVSLTLSETRMFAWAFENGKYDTSSMWAP